MKLLYILICAALFFCPFNDLSARACSDMASMTEIDTVVFNLDQATYSSVDGISYIDFPVMLYSEDPSVNAVDYWFQFDLNKLTYYSTTSALSALDVYSNFNSNNQYLSNTSSTTSILVYLPLNVPIMNLKFAVSDPCSDIVTTDFFSPTVLLNGIVSSYLFIGPGEASQIQLTSADPLCANTDIEFSYDDNYNGHPISSYDWNFGNTSSGTGQTVTGMFSNEGTNTVTLNITTIEGCTHTLTTDVVILPSPAVAFTSVYDGVNNEVVFTNLSDISSGSIDSFSWNFGDDLTSALFEPTHEYASEGFYDVILSATSDLGCTINDTNQVDVPIGVAEGMSRSALLQIYPNPASSQLTIQSTEALSFFILDELGQQVTEQRWLGANQNELISLDNLAAGVYLVVGHSEAHVWQERFVIQR